jgi:hypothetical protein
LTSGDGALNGATTSIMGSAYTNSFAGTATTTLYGIDSTSDSLYIQNPPNNGTQILVGALGVNATSIVGFDISWPGNVGYAALNVGGVSSLYSINLSTGAASLVGAIGSGTQSITGLAVRNDVVPEPSSVVLTGLGLFAAALYRRRR